jgi:tRNA (uracil-5-)-methyltransferase
MEQTPSSQNEGSVAGDGDTGAGDAPRHPAADPELQTFVRNLPPKHQRKDFDRHLRRLGLSFVMTQGSHAPHGITVLWTDAAARVAGEAAISAKRLAGRQLRLSTAPAASAIRQIRWDERELAASRTEEERDFALNGPAWKTKGTKRAREGAEGADGGAEPVVTKTAQEIVAPLASMPYADQLAKKADAMRAVLRKMSHAAIGSQREWKIRGKGGPPEGLLQHKTSDGLACPFEGVLPSPVTDRYRNKNEFTAGWGEDGKPMLGFVSHRPRKPDPRPEDSDDPAVFLAADRRMEPVMVDPTGSPTASEASVRVWRALQPHIATSALQPFQRNVADLPLERRGFWRVVCVRDTSRGDVMVIVTANFKGAGGPAELAAAKAALVALFAKGGAGEAAKVTSLQLVDNDGLNDFTDAEPEVLSGSKTMVEVLSGREFEISPDAFFQTNRAGAEVLYGKIAEWCSTGDDRETTVFDICCGTGTIGCFVADRAKQVVGIEMVPSAIEDARRNAERNGVTNATWVVGKVEDTLRDELRKLPPKARAVAIVDPPRPGLHGDVLRNLRNRADLSELVYVACNPNTVAAAMKALCGPISNKFSALPFHPVRAVAVDMFPGTPHCEFVVHFRRGLEKNNDAAGEGGAEKST